MTEKKDIKVTEEAANFIKKRLQKRGSGVGLRITVKTAGCSGMQYDLEYVDKESLRDHVFPFEEGLAIYVDPKTFQYIKGSTLNCVKKQFNEFLELKNPNEKENCPCGKSFNV